MKRKRPDAPSYARVGTFARGVIWGMCLAGCTREQILECAEKADGVAPSACAGDDVSAKKRKDPEWLGEATTRSGRPKILSEDQLQKLVGLVFKERGTAKVTVKYCKISSNRNQRGKPWVFTVHVTVHVQFTLQFTLNYVGFAQFTLKSNKEDPPKGVYLHLT